MKIDATVTNFKFHTFDIYPFNSENYQFIIKIQKINNNSIILCVSLQGYIVILSVSTPGLILSNDHKTIKAGMSILYVTFQNQGHFKQQIINNTHFKVFLSK